PVTTLGRGQRLLVPRVIRTERIAEWVSGELLCSAIGPLFVKRMLDKLLQSHVDARQIRGEELAFDHHARRRPAMLAPALGIRVRGIVIVVVVPYSEVDQ